MALGEVLSVPPAAAACAPSPVSSGDIVTCTGLDTNGVGSGLEDHVTVTVAPNALIAPATAGFGINLTASNTITNNGVVTGSGGGIQATDHNTIVNTGTIGGSGDLGINVGNGNGITNAGAVSGNFIGIAAQDFNTIVNNGVITGTNAYGILLGNNNTLTNGGIITGLFAGVLAQDSNTITNNGTIAAADRGFAIALAGRGSVTNNGQIMAGAGGAGIAAQDISTIINNGLITAGIGGAGVLTSGGTFINNGTIRSGGYSLYGGAFSGTATFINNGRLDGVIQLGGPIPGTTLVNNGVIAISSPDTPLGRATNSTYWHFIDASFVQSSTGTLELRVNRDGLSDGLSAATPHLGGTLRAVLQPGLYDPVTVYHSVVANCGCTGGDLNGTRFGAVVASAPLFFTAVANYVNDPSLGTGINAVDLVLTRLPFGAVPGETVNQRAVGTALERGYSTTLTGALATFYGSLLTSSSLGALDQMSGEGTIATQQTALLANAMFMNALMTDITAAFAATSGGPEALGYASPQPMHPALQRFAKAPDLDEAWRWRFSAGGFGGGLTSRGNAATGSADQTASGGAALASLSYRVDPQWLVGVALSGGRFSFASAPRATTGDLDTVQAAVFVRGDWNTFRVTAALDVATFDNTTSRVIAGVGPAEVARANFSSELVGGRLEIARPIAWSGITVAPFAAIAPATLWQRARNETSVVLGSGAPGLLGLSYAPVTVTSLPTFLGIQLDTILDLGAGRTLTPSARVAWVHEFRPDRSQDASFIALPASTFTVFGPRVAPDAVQVDAGLRLALTRAVLLQANFTGELSNSRSQYAGSGGLRITW
ncbi:autotransporter outer membrane beta-barrel domain-containing protein [Bradyrhizobium sp. 2TAF24]|uniref:autotransporter outer membrane beta-barrel domain-containing protein n=1 Tax=Bradyrhizobium sp. 2TAF24 TaxID=3233011 RepID=UPI003F935E7C